MVANMSIVGQYYPVAAEKFSALAWGEATNIGQVKALSSEIQFVRVREDFALVISYRGDQKVIPSGWVLRLNRSTGVLVVQSQQDFEELFRPAS